MATSRRELLSDEMWSPIEPLLPVRTPRRGGRWIEHRAVVESICWRFRTGSPWRDLPEDFPSWQTVWWRFDRWAKDGTLDRMLSELHGEAHAAAELEWLVSVDSTVARAHQHAAGARKTGTGGSARITRFRKDDVMHEHLATFTGSDAIMFIGVAQEKAHVFRTERRHNPVTGAAYPWIVTTTAMVNH